MDDRKAEAHEFVEVTPTDEVGQQHLSLKSLMKVRLNITADLGRSAMLVRDVLELKKGSIVPLDKMAGETTDIYLNGLPLAKGEVVVIGDMLHVRIAEVLGVSELQDEPQTET